MLSAKNVVARFLTARFQPGDKVRVKPSHGFKEWHGDTGEIEKLVQFNKAYVQLKDNGRQILDLNDLSKVDDRLAHVLVPNTCARGLHGLLDK